MLTTTNKYGIVGLAAPELKVTQWVDDLGQPSDDVKLSDFSGKFKIIYCFQAWCPGCHSIGLPSLQEMVKALKESDHVSFMAVQTVFEGEDANTYQKMIEVQKKYDLHIPFGHDPGDEGRTGTSIGRSTIMNDFKTGGTPWFIFIDEHNKVVFNDFHLDAKKAIEYLLTLK